MPDEPVRGSVRIVRCRGWFWEQLLGALERVFYPIQYFLDLLGVGLGIMRHVTAQALNDFFATLERRVGALQMKQ